MQKDMLKDLHNSTENSAKALGAIKRKSAHSIPLIITVSANNEVALVDFSTLNDGEVEAFSSVILTKDIAKNLIEQLSEFVSAKVTYETTK